MFEQLFKIAVFTLLVYIAVITKEIRKTMADDFSKLEQAQLDNATAIDNAVSEINDLVAKLGATPPSNQPEIDKITEAINAKTAALAAAAKVPAT